MIDFNIHRLASLVNQLAEQRQFDGRLVKQISCLEENVTNCQVALEQLQHMMEKLRKCVFILPVFVSSRNNIEILYDLIVLIYQI